MKSSEARGPLRKNSSQVCPTGEMILSTPRARTSTFLTPSGNRASAGRRTAWERLLVKTEVMLMVARQRVYGTSICLRRVHRYVRTESWGETPDEALCDAAPIVESQRGIGGSEG